MRMFRHSLPVWYPGIFISDGKSYTHYPNWPDKDGERSGPHSQPLSEIVAMGYWIEIDLDIEVDDVF